jgi:hypothetical protein
MHLLRLLEDPNNLLDNCTAPDTMHRTYLQSSPSSLGGSRFITACQDCAFFLALTLPDSGEIMRLPRLGAPQTIEPTCGETIHPTTAWRAASHTRLWASAIVEG